MLLGHRHGKARQGGVLRGEHLSLEVLQLLSYGPAVLGCSARLWLQGAACKQQRSPNTTESPPGPAGTQDIPSAPEQRPWERLEKHLERSKGSPDPAWSWVWQPGAQRQPVPALCPASQWPEQRNRPHRLQVLRLGIVGAKQAGGRFAFSRRVGVL